jgi:hypothetical protein
MNWAALLGVCLVWIGGCAPAQPLRVYSEFAKIDAHGNVTAPESPREILSPAIARNAFSTFQVVIQVPPGTPYTFRVGLNPESAVKVMLYRETAGRAVNGGPELKRIDEPWESSSTQILWMDLWVEKDAPVRRIKVEPQLFLDGDWVIYPMEVRVREQQVPTPSAQGAVPTAASFLDPFIVMQAALCKKPLTVPGLTATTAAGLRYRNAIQDVALAEAATDADREDLKKRLGGCNAKLPADPEAYLRVRDYFFTPLWMKVKRN